MSGHSKWATTKHKKAAIDSKRAKIFAKLVKNVEVASRVGGPDPDGNPSLALAILKAKKMSVPYDNIDRAVKRGAGLIDGGADYQTIMYEGYGPSGVALLIECLTENKNRAASDVRVAVTRNGGNMGDPGSVSYMFHRKGVVTGTLNSASEDDIMMEALESGADDVTFTKDSFEIICSTQDVRKIAEAISQLVGEDNVQDDTPFVADVDVELDEKGARTLMNIVDALEDLDDVQEVHTNAKISPEILQTLENE